MKNKKIIVVCGPTASGKTDVAIQLAKQHACPIISADSRQVYKEMNIGVARPSKAQLAEVKHYFIATVSIEETYNAGIYCQEGRKLINSLFHSHDTLVVCGGTGLYIKALLKGLDVLPNKNEALRSELQELHKSEGIQALQNRLKKSDPERFEATDKLNPLRLIRAIEIAESPIQEDNLIPPFEFEFETEYKILDIDREVLYTRISNRVDTMIKDGLETEVKNLLPYRNTKALQSVGYSEWWPYFDGQCKLEDVVSKIKQHSRNYAKRQITWFKHQVD